MSTMNGVGVPVAAQGQSLPLSGKVACNEDPGGPGRNEAGTVRAGVLAGVVVLLVEDDPLSREALELILEFCGARVLSAETAGEALRAYEQGLPSVIISDVGLPDLDGCALMRAIRSREAGADHVPAIAVSGYTSRATGERARRAGFDAFFSKPVEVDVLLQTVQALTSM
jgi:two-component system CheB/CheR fusion protein